MNNLMKWLEEKFTPKMQKVNHNIWIVTLKDSVNQTIPLVFLGSIFAMLTLPGSIFNLSWWPNFWTPQGWTMGMISLMISFLIPFNLMEKLKLRRSRFVAAITGIILYAITITPQLMVDGVVGFGHSAFGAGGMFIAIVTGIVVGLVFRLFGRFSFFKEDSVIPDFVRQWFDQLLPMGLVTVAGWILIDLLGFDLYNTIMSVFSPLQNFAQTFPGFMLMIWLYTFLYCMGISSWVLTPITTPILLSAIEANMAGDALYVNTNSFGYAYLYIGGVGCTLALAFLMVFKAKSKKLSALGKASIIPSIFNINEPVVFGCIAWNPILMIPMNLCTIVVAFLAYLFTKIIPMGVIPNITFSIWYCPYPICTWLATGGSLLSVLLVILLFFVTLVIWYPFFSIYDKQCVEEESREGKQE